MKSSLLAAIATVVVTSIITKDIYAKEVAAISECPSLTARPSGPANVTDLRADDIKVVGALGDSIMAGFALEGMDANGTGLLNISSVTEFRGKSYGIGGDPGANTLANYIKHYNSSLLGASVGSHIAEICNGKLCFDFFRFPQKDKLNAALSGAIAQNLDAELDFMIEQMKNTPGLDFENDWKMITIQIGSNDQCASCLSPWANEVTADKYSGYVEAALNRIKGEIPRTIVNLAGTFKVSQVYYLTVNKPYCHALFNQSNLQFNRVECSCFLEGEDALKKMDTLTDNYNTKLEALYQKFKTLQSETFAVAYQPANIDIGSFPVELLSNVDCFHPNDKAHAYIAKELWKNLFIKPESKPSVFTYKEDVKIYCPTDDDRIWI